MSKRRRVRRKKTGRRTRPPGEKRFEKLAEKVRSAKGLRFGKRVKVGHKYLQEVKDQRGRVVDRVPWNQKTKREVRAAVEVYYGTETKRTIREAGMAIPGWSPVSGAYDVETHHAVWTRSVWAGPGVPVGTPELPKDHRSFGYFGAAFEAVDPASFGPVINKLPDQLLGPQGVIGLVVKLAPKDGGPEITHVHYKTKMSSYLSTSERQFLNGLFEEVLTEIAHTYGYAGEVDVVEVSLIVGGPTV